MFQLSCTGEIQNLASEPALCTCSNLLVGHETAGVDEGGAFLEEAVFHDVVPAKGFDVGIDKEVVGGAIVPFDGDLMRESVGGVSAGGGAGEMKVIAGAIIVGDFSGV